MSRPAHCKLCGVVLKPEEKVKFKSKTYCTNCYTKLNRESEEYKSLIAYICDVFNIEKPTGMMLAQIKDYKNNYSYTYGGMKYTLWYYTEIAQKEPIVKYGVGSIKYYYEEAKNYYSEQEKRIEKAKLLSDTVNDRILTRKARRNTPHNLLVNIEDIIKGGEVY